MKRFLTVCAVTAILSSSAAYASVGWANYQWPCYGASYANNQGIDIYSQVWKGGCTDQAGPCPDLSVTLYYKKPSDASYTALPMVFNVDIGNNDEFTGQIPASATDASEPMWFYIQYFDMSDGTYYDPMDHCGGGTVPPMVLNITPATMQDVTVYMRVDMSCLPADLYSAGVFFAGSFTGWSSCWPGASMTDSNNDGVYEGAWTFPAGANPYQEYKHNRSGSDGCQWESNIGNRAFVIDDSSPSMTLDVVYWDNWVCCQTWGPAEITAAGSYCVSLCIFPQMLSVPLNTPYGMPIIPGLTVIPGCDLSNTGCDDECLPGNGTVQWDVRQDAAGQWFLDLAISEGQDAMAGCFCVTIEQILPVEFGTFDAIAGNGEVTLRWTTLSERDNARFDVLRDGFAVAQVPSLGNSALGHHYAWTDRAAVNGTAYTYTLVAVDITGARGELATASATPQAGVVTEYVLGTNYPNPFNPSTSIAYSLKEAGHVTLTVYDLTGRLVQQIVNREQPAGRYTAAFDGTGLPSAIYYYRLSVNGFNATQKMVLIK